MSAGYVPHDQDEQSQQLGGLNIPPLPAHESTITSGSEVEKPQLAPEQVSALGDVANATAAQGQATQDAAVPATQQAQAEADTAKAMADQQAKVTAARDAEDTKQLANVSKMTEAYKAANDAIKAQPPVTLGADRNTWGRLTLALGMALSGFGDAVNARATVLGGHDVRTHSLKDLIDSDLDRQREMVAKLKDNQLIALTGVKDAQQARELALSRIDMKGAEMAKQLQLRGEALTKSAGVNTPALAAKLKALELDTEAAKFRSQAVAPLTQRVTKRSGTSNTDRDQKPPAAGSTPSVLTDSLSKQDLPIDPTRTDPRQHNAAVQRLPSINTFLDTGAQLANLKPGAPELMAKLGVDSSTSAGAQGNVIALRKAYAGAKGEPQSVEQEHSQDVIPDAPTSMSSAATVKNFHTKLKARMDEMAVMRREQLANAGVTPQALAKYSNPTEAPAKAAPATAERTAREKATPAAAPTAIGPNGHRITVVGGKWVDATTGAPVQ